MWIEVGLPGTAALELADRHWAGSWVGPERVSEEVFAERIRVALESAAGELPPLRRMVVPGDRVAIALDPATAGWPAIVRAVVAELVAGEVETGAISVVSTAEHDVAPRDFPMGLDWSVHDPDSRSDLAYLAATRGGRRIYLNRRLTDADLVVSVGRLERSPLRMFGGQWAREPIVGPWSVVFPGLSDAPTRAEAAGLPDQDATGERPALHAGGYRESREVGALLGSVYEIGVIPGADDGVHGVACGLLHESVAPLELVRDAWRFEPEAPADVVIARIGRSGEPASWTSLVAGVLSALRLVREGGTLVVFCPIATAPGPAVAALATSEEIRPRAALRRLGSASDYVLAQSLVSIAPVWHVALASGLERETVEGLGFIPFEGVATAQRLVDAAGSCIFVERPEVTGIRLVEGS